MGKVKGYREPVQARCGALQDGDAHHVAEHGCACYVGITGFSVRERPKYDPICKEVLDTWLNNYAGDSSLLAMFYLCTCTLEFAVNGGLLDRSGNSGCGLVERVHVTSTQSPNV